MKSLFKAGRLAVAAVTWLVIAVMLVSPVLAEVPLENPETAQTAFSGVALFSHYSSALDLVLEEQPSDVEVLLDKIAFANIPSNLDEATGQFTSSTIEAAHQFAQVSHAMDNLTQLVAESRWEEAGDLIPEMSDAISEAKGRLAQMEQAIEVSGQVFRVDAAPADSDLRNAYDAVLEKIGRIWRILAQYQDIIDGLSTPNPGAATNLTLGVNPQVAFVGDSLNFRGALTVGEGKAVEGREVHILLNGLPVAVAVTGSGGFYHGSLRLPYWYVKQIAVQALYYPEAGDVGLYRASLSPEVTLLVRFYEATLTLKVPPAAYPGRETRVVGTFDYGSSLMASERSVEIYLDDVLVAGLQARPHVDYKIYISPDTELGEHVVTVSAAAAGRYAPVVATAGLKVTRVTPVVDLETPGIVLIPWSAHFSGSVRTTAGSIEAASITTTLGGSQVQVASADDGTFDAAVKMGWGLDLFGTGQLQVRITPQEPWCEPVVISRSVYLVNVVNCGGLLVILVVLGIYVPRRLKGKLGLWPSTAGVSGTPATAPAPVYTAQTTSFVPAGDGSEEAAGGPRERILRWYVVVLRLVQRITRVSPRPDQTLREFARETEPSLGPLARRFAESTAVVERLLYSSYDPSEEDAERARLLSQNLRKGQGGEAR